jgi:hypothetical protein
MHHRPRGTNGPSCSHRSPHRNREGAGNAGALAAPWPACEKNARGGHRRSAETSPALPARWFTRLYVISSGTGVLAPVACELVAIRRLGISTGMPGPHDFAVRLGIVRRRDQRSRCNPIRPSHPGPTFVTIAKRPSDRAWTRGNVNLICPTTQVIFSENRHGQHLDSAAASRRGNNMPPEYVRCQGYTGSKQPMD